MSLDGNDSLTDRKILLLGSGFVAKPTLDYLARDPKNHITVGMTQSAPL